MPAASQTVINEQSKWLHMQVVSIPEWQWQWHCQGLMTEAAMPVLLYIRVFIAVRGLTVFEWSGFLARFRSHVLTGLPAEMISGRASVMAFQNAITASGC